MEFATDEQTVKNLKFQSKDYMFAHGVVYGGVMAPQTLYPQVVPRSSVEGMKQVGPLFSKLVAGISRDIEFLQEVHKNVHDPFTERLLQICLEVEKNGGDRQPVQMGIFRSDYMMHSQESKMLQVELNTISVSFIALGELVTGMHRFFVERGYIKGADINSCPVATPIKSFCDTMNQANILYNKPGSVVVLITEESEKNTADQRHLEYNLWDMHKIALLRKTFREIANEAVVDPITKDIVLYVGEEGHPVSVFYLRTGYTPEQYPSEVEWDTRLLIESSTSVVVPNIRYHLCGTKKMQQVWCNPGTVEKFLTAEESKLLRSYFAGQYSLDACDHPEEIINKVKANPKKYVMKPQREGGGNLIFEDEMVNALITMTDEDRASYIIMDLIETPVSTTYFHLVHNGEEYLETLPGVSEFGTYEFLLENRNTKEFYVNKSDGILVRTKHADDHEGGVCAGRGFLNSIYMK